jgi:integrase
MSTWVYQDVKQVKKHGSAKAAWYVGWIDPDGKKRCKSCGLGRQGKRDAEKLADKTHSQLVTGTYKDATKKTWTDFKAEYEARIASNMLPQTRRLTMEALAHFERLIKPARVATIKTQTLDDYITKRRKERGKRKGETVRPATVNKELRHLRAVLRIAHEWKYLPDVPRFRFVKEPGKLATFVSPEHFAALYQACSKAERPDNVPGIDPADWWRGLIVMAYMTGWRISELLAVRREDVDLDTGWAVTRAADNKGKRDEQVKLHTVVVEHLRKLAAFSPNIFAWGFDETALYAEFHRLQNVAGISIPCLHLHEHTAACSHYGFHDLRRAFATQNAPRLTADALQKLMRHKSYLTTQRYINMASQLDQAVDSLHVPEVLKATGA